MRVKFELHKLEVIQVKLQTTLLKFVFKEQYYQLYGGTKTDFKLKKFFEIFLRKYLKCKSIRVFQFKYTF